MCNHIIRRNYRRYFKLYNYCLHHVTLFTSLQHRLLGAFGASEPYTSWKNGMSIAFTKIYVKIWINGMSVTRSQKFTIKTGQITYKLCIHHTNNYQCSLLMLHIRLVCTFITWRITSLVTLYDGNTCDNGC